MKKYCYVCGKVLSECPSSEECKCHDEHIIPNAIGGHLTSRNFLCESCGGGLSKGDKAFTDIFAPFIVFLNQAGLLRSLDRDNVDKKVLPGRIFENNELSSTPIHKIRYQKGKAAPCKPFYRIDETNKKVFLFAEKKTAKHYRAHVEQQMKNDAKNIDQYHFEVFDDLSNLGFLGINFSKGKPDFNQDLKDGLLKIATEIALYVGVKREDLASVLDIDESTGNSTYKINTYIWPYTPQSLPDILYENERYKIDANYPAHILKVFTETNTEGGKSLLCYIELFSTFQYYVLLNDDYKGKEVDFTYAQKLSPNYVESIEDLEAMDNSDLDIAIRDAKLSREELNGQSREEICAKIYDIQRRRGSEFNLNAAVIKDYEWISRQILLTLATIVQEKHCTYLLDSTLRSFVKIQKSHKYTCQEVTDAFAEQSKEAYFRKMAIVKEEGQLVARSYPELCLQLYNKHPEYVQEYTTVKFSQLSNYCYKKAGVKTE